MKRVRVTCYDPISVEPTYRQPWADVWIRFKARPARRTYKLGPTLLSRPELHIDIRRAKENGETEEEIRLKRIDSLLNITPIYVDIQYPDPEYPNVYTAADCINRTEAEAMLQALMTSLGFGRSNFKWRNPAKKFVLYPVSVE